jgi:hypothetical protein
MKRSGQKRFHAKARIREKREKSVDMNAQIRASGVTMVEDNSSNAIAESWCTKIDEKAKLEVHEAQIGQGLLPVNGKQDFKRLQLDQKTLLHHQICSKGDVEDPIADDHRNRNLALYGKTPLHQHVRQHSLVD